MISGLGGHGLQGGVGFVAEWVIWWMPNLEMGASVWVPLAVACFSKPGGSIT